MHIGHRGPFWPVGDPPSQNAEGYGKPGDTIHVHHYLKKNLKRAPRRDEPTRPASVETLYGWWYGLTMPREGYDSMTIEESVYVLVGEILACEGTSWESYNDFVREAALETVAQNEAALREDGGERLWEAYEAVSRGRRVVDVEGPEP